ncbi:MULTISPECIES: NAD(P)/FAD-dependent oxidoreductase [unclassified Phenylobacterium]|uniref:NAD(P)/FAD-dependent oxidoreductase n=1 Tax=unclassified Phenylobacterium TaxID=2640670 RepID=UPI00083B9D88|nr:MULTISPECIES: NAD(P)/FAD-dependent oxidoreductase [unclassified Phenylobacterium]
MDASPAPERYEAVVVGAGPGGLTAATYLGRFRRRVLVLDGGPSRATWIPESHNTPGFPRGIGGDELLARLRDQAEEYGAVIRPGRVERLQPIPEGFQLEVGGVWFEAPTALLATGVVDRLPDVPGLEAAIKRGQVRMCPICDAYEATGAKIAVLGAGPLAQREADFLRTYSPNVTVLIVGEAEEAPSDAARISLSDLQFEGDQVRLSDAGGETRFDHLYLALGCASQTALALALGAGQDDRGDLVVDSHQMTSVDGLYAVGDVVRGLNQIAVAAGEAAIAATAMHNRLRKA